MAYTKTTWTSSTVVNTTNMNNAETQYDEAYAGALSHTHDDRYYTRTEMDNWFWHAGNDGHGSGMDCDMLYYPGGNKHFADFSAAGIVSGVIIMWDGAVLPSGWVECNGSNGTPDLTDGFVIGAGGAYAVGASGGYNSWTQNYTITVAAHTLTVAELPAHGHIWYDAKPPATGIGGGDAPGTYSGFTTSTGDTTDTGGNGSHTHNSPASYATINWTENKPPCVALRYIMKT
jgi:microcystin-dependent protein